MKERGQKPARVWAAQAARSCQHVGDAHLMNCNECGAYFSKTGSLAVRDPRRVGGLSKLYSSDILRNMYSQCQLRPQRKEFQIKISS